MDRYKIKGVLNSIRRCTVTLDFSYFKLLVQELIDSTLREEQDIRLSLDKPRLQWNRPLHGAVKDLQKCYQTNNYSTVGSLCNEIEEIVFRG